MVHNLTSASRVCAAILLLALSTGTSYAAGDAARGAVVFERCALCHNTNKDGGSGLGPNLFRVSGRKAGTLPDFPYSSALKNSRIVWTDSKLKAWVMHPARLVPGSSMTFAGLPGPQADNVVAYLRTRR